MPKHPSVDPDPSSFGPLPTLDQLGPLDHAHIRSSLPWPQHRAFLDDDDGEENDDSDRTTTTTTKAKARRRALRPLREGASPLLIGGNAFGTGMYHADELINSLEPFRIIRLALALGFNTIDTSPYYYPSEFILGRVLETLSSEFPRSSYYLCTKCGRYGPRLADFDYSAAKVRESVRASLTRLRTEYLDAVLLHDAEFVAERVGQSHEAGWEAAKAVVDHGGGVTYAGAAAAATATTTTTTENGAETKSRRLQLVEEAREARRGLGLDAASADRIHGAGDERILECVAELFRFKDRGLVRNVGLSGYPLPVLLRLSRLVFARLGRPLDVVLSYSNHTLHSDLLPAYLVHFATRPGSEPDAEQLDGRDERREEQQQGVGVEEGSATASSEASGQRGADDDRDWTPPLVLNASPFSMGLLTDSGPPDWHPASPELLRACRDASALLEGRLAQAALGYGIRPPPPPSSSSLSSSSSSASSSLRTLVGMGNQEQVWAAARAYLTSVVPYVGTDARARGGTGTDDSTRREDEVRVEALMRQRDVWGWSWASPPPDAL